jgi:hypothetical protein
MALSIRERSDMITPYTLIRQLAEDINHGFSLGTFGASGEFMHTRDELAELIDTDSGFSIHTDKGGMKVSRDGDARLIAYDTLSSDGESWSQALVACAPFSDDAPEVITDLGEDSEAIRPADRSARLFDIGVGKGLVRFCIRTRSPELIAACEAATGMALMGGEAAELPGLVLRHQPERVLISPFARIEVYQPIPPADGDSPEGPHTHLLPQLLAKRRIHSANTPIPAGLQSVLNCHPPSPWRDGLGRRIPFDQQRNDAFVALLRDYALPADRAVEHAATDALATGIPASAFVEPGSRRERAKLRITLRRLAREAGIDPALLAEWCGRFDRAPVEDEDEQELAHA